MTSRARASRPRAVTTVKMTRGLKRNLAELGYESQDEKGDGDLEIPKDQKDKRKRRRLDEDPGGERASSPPAPTTAKSPKTLGPAAGAPIEGESSSLVAPKMLSASQKVEYQSVELEDQQTSHKTDTNATTPRNHQVSSDHISLRAPTPESDVVLSTTATRRSGRTPARRRRDSSPDIISTTESKTSRGRRAATNARGRAVDSAQQREIDHVDDDGDGDDKDWVKAEDAFVAVESVRNTRQRGRPKKKEAAAVSLGAEQSEEPSTEPKKNKPRGRPKKKPPSTETTSESAARQNAQNPAHKSEELNAGDGCDDEDPGAHNQPEAVDNTKSSHRMLQELDGNEIVSNNDNHDKGGDSRLNALEEAEKVAEKEVVPVISVSNAATTPRPSSFKLAPASAGKPVYRVGLSKRSRIEPLLKTLRK